jgi:CheY-like chemotaxis protein
MHDGFPVLLVEDAPDDVWLVKRAFASAGLQHPLFAVEDGGQAIDYLCGKGQYADRKAFPLPRLVIADLKMPRVDGFQLIKWMRDDIYARMIPIIVMSSSALAQDVNRAYELGANAYMVKPANFLALEQLMTTIARFWDAGQQPHIDGSRTSLPNCSPATQ